MYGKETWRERNDIRTRRIVFPHSTHVRSFALPLDAKQRESRAAKENPKYCGNLLGSLELIVYVDIEPSSRIHTAKDAPITTIVQTNCYRDSSGHVDRSVAKSDERELIERSATDPASVADLYRRHHAAIGQYIQRRVGCSHDAEDLIAETFMAMVRYLPKYRMWGVPFRAWLYRLATNQVNRWAKRNRRAAMKTLTAKAEQTPIANDGSLDRMIEAEEVRLALLSVSPRYQAVLSLHYMEGMSVTEIAQVLRCAEGTVKSRLARGREKMRTQLRSRENQNER